ncbi:unnamed protein product [Echinostoma caproni]|uniref:LicD family protein n=1 Tax=Echinostoma caproni TaxID=27848 RepID=A0A183ARE1_9TREM|nr:unnamed protein product [Echinostoma caproni]
MFDNGLGDKFVLYSGTLIESYRHHHIIPWDDDLNVLVGVTVKSNLQTLLEQLSPEYQLRKQHYRDKFPTTKQKNHNKFYTFTDLVFDTDSSDLLLSHCVSVSPLGWPNLDIGYYQ